MNKDSVKDYINLLESGRGKIVTQLINVIEQNIPKGFEKVMNYGMPSFVIPHSIYPKGYHVTPDLPLPFIGIASQKNHIGFYHMGLYADSKLLDWFMSEYPKYCKLKLDMGKSCIRFKNISEIPYELIGILSSKMTVKDWIDIYEQNIKR